MVRIEWNKTVENEMEQGSEENGIEQNIREEKRVEWYRDRMGHSGVELNRI